MHFVTFFSPVLLASLPTPAPTTFATTAELEAAVNAGVRADLADGGHLAADPDSWGTILTVVDGDVATRHVVTMDVDDGEGGTYRTEVVEVEEGMAPLDPDSLIGAGFAAEDGGVLITPSCGDWYFEGYLVERAETGKRARALVAEALRAADDLEWVRDHAGEVSFALRRGEDALTLAVTLGDDGAVIGAELSRVAWHFDDGSYDRKDELDRALKRGKVLAIHVDGDDTVLVTGEKSFAIDPDGDAFVAAADHEEVCGC
jgi:hypothetical protein